jgi:lactate 2-monooxygenase
MSFSGSMIQNAIYIAQQPPGWPVSFEDWERAAEEKLDPGAFGYIAGGAGAESTMRANLDAFQSWRIRPRMLAGNAVRDISIDVLGMHSPAPFFLAPVGVLSIAHEEAEVGVGKASASSGVPMLLSSAATHSIEEVAATGAPRWFQLYWVNDREICASFVQRAEAAGYGAIVVTLDTLTLGWRPRDLRRAYLPFIKGEGCGQYFSDPVFLSKLDKTPDDDLLAAAASGSSAGVFSRRLQKTGSLKNCAQPWPLRNGRYALRRSRGRQPSVSVSSVTTIAAYPAASARSTKLAQISRSLTQ